MNDVQDIVIVGGGILGTFHAYHALMAGKRVTLLEKNLAPEGATVRNFGQIVPSGMDLKWQRYGRRSLEIYKSLHAEIGLSMKHEGSVYLASNEEEMRLIEELSQINHAEGYPSHLLDADTCFAQYPGLRKDYCVGGLFFPDEVSLNPRLAVHQVLAWLVEQKGLTYHPQTTVIGVENSSQGVALTDTLGRTFTGDQAIVCSGTEFALLFPDLFRESDIEVSKLHMFSTVSQPHQRIPGNILTGLSIRRYESFRSCPSYAQIKAGEDPNSLWKKWSVHILFKQAADGTVIIGDSHEYADAAEVDQLGFDVNEEINRYILTEAQQIFELEDWQIGKTWLGWYSQCKTQDIFQHTIDDRIHIVTGIGGKGMTASPGFAEANYARLFG